MEETVVRKRTTKKVATRSTARKAPVREVGEVTNQKSNLIPFLVLGFFVLVIGVSVAVGFTDKGQINVSNTINEKRTSGTPEEQEQFRNIPVQNQKTSLPNGGLVPTSDLDPGTTPPPPPVQPEASATSSLETGASSTDATVPDEVTGEPSGEATEETVAEGETVTE